MEATFERRKSENDKSQKELPKREEDLSLLNTTQNTGIQSTSSKIDGSTII